MERVASLPGDLAASFLDALRHAGDEVTVSGHPRQVIAFEVDFEKYGLWVNKGKALPIERFQVFRSAIDASRHVGCEVNQVGTRLAEAKREGREGATVHGVTFRYVEDCGSD